MTTIDPFERDLTGALDDLADAQTPDYFVDLLGRTARTRQRPAWAIPGRWFSHMPALTPRSVAALATVLVVAILGGAFLFNRSNQTVGSPTSSPAPSPGASAYASPLPMPSALVGGWLGPTRISPIVQSRVASINLGHLDNNYQAPDFAIGGPGGDNTPSNVHEVSPGVIEMVATGSLGGCTKGDVGHYGWKTSADGTWLTLTKIDDACTTRGDYAPGTWVRNGSTDSHGGPLVAANFDPFVSFTLPSGNWLGGGGNGVFTADNGEATFKVWQDPDGFNDPCDDTKGTVVLDRGIDPFLAFLRGPKSGLTLSNERETTVDGHRAVIVDIRGADLPKPCWTDPDTKETNMVLQWTQHADPGWKWSTDVAGTTSWPIVITEVGGHTIVFEDIKAGNVLDQAVLDSVRFLTALPTPPAS